MMAAERRDVGALLAETRLALDIFEAHLNDFSTALDELEAESARQRAEPGRRRWL
jgi:hypothetical protein